MGAATMSPELHERGIHAVKRGGIAASSLYAPLLVWRVWRESVSPARQTPSRRLVASLLSHRGGRCRGRGGRRITEARGRRRARRRARTRRRTHGRGRLL